MTLTIGQPFPLLYLFFFVVFSLTFSSQIDPTIGQFIALENGLIEGKVETIFDSHVTSYLGIPYAEPPVGDGRFRKPKPFRSTFDQVYNATYFRPACSQKFGDEAIEDLGGVSFDEDCLHLNIWVPQPLHRSGPKRKLKPVLFYVFGSAFHKASPARPSHRGEYLSAAGDIIVVVPNYRLGFLGFACCGENYEDERMDDMPGNLALYDLLLALKWTRDNIRRFGGDPEAITLSGASAGAMISIMLLHSEGMHDSWIKNVFIMSGVPADGVAIDPIDVAIAKTRFITEKVSCSRIVNESIPQPLTKEEIDCLRTSANLTAILELQDSEEVVLIGQATMNGIIGVYGDALIRHSPESSLRGPTNKHRNLKTFVFGNVQNEGNFDPDFWPLTKTEALTYLLPKMRSMLKSDSIETLTRLNRTIDFYFGSVDENDDYEVVRAMRQLFSDWVYRCPTLEFAQQLALKGNLVHLYLFDYVSEIYLGLTGTNERPFGSLHGDDTRMVFGNPFRDTSNYDHHDRQVSRMMMEIYSDFISNKRVPWPPILTDRSGRIETLRWRIDGDLESRKDIEIIHSSGHCDELNKLRNIKLFEKKSHEQVDNQIN